MTAEQCRAELLRICEALRGRAGKLGCRPGSTLKPAGAACLVLSWLGEQTLNDPRHRCDAEELYLNTISTSSDREGWDKVDESVKTSSKDSMRRAIIDVRAHIKNFNQAENSPNGVQVDLPKGLQTAEPSARWKGPYGLRFQETKTGSQETSASEAEAKTTSPVEVFWDKAVTLHDQARALLVYPTDPSRLRNRHLDTRGLTAGSGEVAGAFALAGALGAKWRHVDVCRSNDVTLNELRKAPCVILLGSSIKNELYQRLRSELSENTCWPNQAFRFTETKKG